MGRKCITNEEEEGCIQAIGGKPERKTQLGTPRHRWADYIKKDLGEIEWAGLDSIDLAQVGDQWRVL